jgi:hypothetical protein
VATIIEGAFFTMTEEAAEVLVADGIIFICGAEHIDTLEVDKPVYHLARGCPSEVGFTNLHTYIKEAERRAEKERQAKIYEESKIGLL